jgi:predicted lipoprotein with Yx(FWY)xxD motif
MRVTDANGRSLYRFDKDTAKPSHSNCTGACATTWPPLLVHSGQALYVDGINPQLTGFIELPDGSCQITIGGWPVYYFSKDMKPGDLLGQGVGGTWFAVGPTGGKALAK